MQGWQEIENFPGYLVNPQGDIYGELNGRLLKTRQNNKGVVMVGIQQDSRQHMRSVAKLVAEAFVDVEHPYFNTVIHLNGDKTDCRALNLKWRSRPFALRYTQMFDEEPYRVGVHIPKIRKKYASLREFCTTYGLIESMTYSDMNNGEPCFPYGWILKRLDP